MKRRNMARRLDEQVWGSPVAVQTAHHISGCRPYFEAAFTGNSRRLRKVAGELRGRRKARPSRRLGKRSSENDNARSDYSVLVGHRTEKRRV